MELRQVVAVLGAFFGTWALVIVFEYLLVTR